MQPSLKRQQVALPLMRKLQRPECSRSEDGSLHRLCLVWQWYALSVAAMSSLRVMCMFWMFPYISLAIMLLSSLNQLT